MISLCFTNHNLNFTMIIEVKEDSLGAICELNASIDSGIMKTVPMFKKNRKGLERNNNVQSIDFK